MSTFDRNEAIRIQTPAFSETVLDEAASLKNQANNAGLLGISPAVDKFFIPSNGEEVHHVSGLRMLDGIYANTTEAQRAELQRIGGSGHAMLNFLLMPGEIHQGRNQGADSIHNFLRQEGLEVSGHIDPSSFIGRTEAVRNASFEEKLALMNEYVTDILPRVKDKINGLMTDYYGRKSDTRMAKDVLPVLENVVKGGPGTSTSKRYESPGTNRDRALNIYAGGNVSIGEGVLRSNGNGNGNGHKKNGQRMPMRRG